MQDSQRPWAILALVVAVCAAVLIVDGVGEESLRLLIRVTARFSLTLLTLGVAAPALAALWNQPLVAALARWRESWLLGLLFNHAVHLGLVLWLWRYSAALPFGKPGGGIALFLNAVFFAITFMAMVRTSSALAWLERTRGGRLQSLAMLFFYVALAVAYVRRALSEPFYYPEAAAILAMAVLWLAVKVKKKNMADATQSERSNS